LKTRAADDADDDLRPNLQRPPTTSRSVDAVAFRQRTSSALWFVWGQWVGRPKGCLFREISSNNPVFCFRESLGRSGMSGAIHPLASGLPASSENAYHPRQFRVHLGADA
jgi:hypothetical protein